MQTDGQSITARIGEKLVSLAANGKKLDALLQEWDPNGDVPRQPDTTEPATSCRRTAISLALLHPPLT